MNMIKRILIVCLVFSNLAAMAQEPQVLLPWIPLRDTNHIRTIRNYSYDTATLERKLESTEEYDRHGYRAGELVSLTYNGQGLLTRRVARERHFNSANPMGWIDTASVWDIVYSSDGVMQRFDNVYYYHGYIQNEYVQDTTVVTCELLSHKVHPVFGLQDYTVKQCLSRSSRGESYCDTIYFRREYDDKGHLLKEYSNYEEADNYIFHYRPDGRLEYRIGIYYEWSDSLYYHYDNQGVLTHMTGKLYDLDVEADLFIRCQPDGRRIEERQVQRIHIDEGKLDDGTTEIIQYDSHGLLIRCRMEDGKVPYYEREIDYWE